jgi:hypothetical protein
MVSDRGVPGAGEALGGLPHRIDCSAWSTSPVGYFRSCAPSAQFWSGRGPSRRIKQRSWVTPNSNCTLVPGTCRASIATAVLGAEGDTRPFAIEQRVVGRRASHAGCRLGRHASAECTGHDAPASQSGKYIERAKIEESAARHEHEGKCRLEQVHPADEDLIGEGVQKLSTRTTYRLFAQHFKWRATLSVDAFEQRAGIAVQRTFGDLKDDLELLERVGDNWPEVGGASNARSGPAAGGASGTVGSVSQRASP